jgi:hypothetical protein
MNSLSDTGPAGVWFGYQVAAAAILTVLCLVVVYLRKPPGRQPRDPARPGNGSGSTSTGGQATAVSSKSGLITGYDGRISTSKTITFSWTFVVAWMLITVGFVSAASSASFADLLKNTSNLYLVLLGGPYAAAILAKVSVSSGVQTGRIQKTSATSTGPADIVRGDTGSADLYDFQYTLFNLVAIVIVIFLFGAHPGKGFPGIPDFLAILTGGSALTYTVNKAATSNAPSISDVQPRIARVGDTARITGTNLLLAAAGNAQTVVGVGGVQAQQVTLPGLPDTIDFTVPAPATGAWPPDTAQQVAVTTTAGAIATLNGALTIVADQPVITHVTPPRLKVGDQASVFGSFLLAPGTASGNAAAATDSIGGLTGVISADTITWPIQFNGNYTNASVSVTIGAPSLGGQSAPENDTPAMLTLSRAGGQASAPVTITPAPVTTAAS